MFARFEPPIYQLYLFRLTQFDAPTAATATICKSLAAAAVGVRVSFGPYFYSVFLHKHAAIY